MKKAIEEKVKGGLSPKEALKQTLIESNQRKIKSEETIEELSDKLNIDNNKVNKIVADFTIQMLKETKASISNILIPIDSIWMDTTTLCSKEYATSRITTLEHQIQDHSIKKELIEYIGSQNIDLQKKAIPYDELQESYELGIINPSLEKFKDYESSQDKKRSPLIIEMQSLFGTLGHLKEGSYFAAIVPPAFLFSRTTMDYRKTLLEKCNLRAIIDMPIGTVTGMAISFGLLIGKKKYQGEENPKELMVADLSSYNFKKDQEQIQKELQHLILKWRGFINKEEQHG